MDEIDDDVAFLRRQGELLPCGREFTRIADRLELLLRTTPWRPIETAPKDRPIIMANKWGISLVEYDRHDRAWYEQDPNSYLRVFGGKALGWMDVPRPTAPPKDPE